MFVIYTSYIILKEMHVTLNVFKIIFSICVIILACGFVWVSAMCSTIVSETAVVWYHVTPSARTTKSVARHTPSIVANHLSLLEKWRNSDGESFWAVICSKKIQSTRTHEWLKSMYDLYLGQFAQIRIKAVRFKQQVTIATQIAPCLSFISDISSIYIHSVVYMRVIFAHRCFGRFVVWPVSKWYFHAMQRIQLHLWVYTLRLNCKMHGKRAWSVWDVGAHNGGANTDGHIPKTSMMICKLHEFVHAVYVLQYGNICHMAPSFLDQLLCMLLQALASKRITHLNNSTNNT